MELTLDQVLKKGVEAHKIGQIQEANRLYSAILQTQPKHPDANHNMGVLAVGLDKIYESLPFFKTALEANPSVAQFWLSFIDALIKLDKLTDAQTIYDQARAKGASGEAFDQLGQQLSKLHINHQQPPSNQLQSIINFYTQGQFQQALFQANEMLMTFPNLAVLYNITGASHAGLSQVDAAIDNYKQALKIKPDYAEVHSNMGAALKDKGDLDAAIDSYKQALKINPDYADVHYNMGNVLIDKGNVDLAINSYKKTLEIDPDHALANVNMSDALQNVVFSKPSSILQNIITSILDSKNYVRPKDISKAAISLLKFEPVIKELLKNNSIGKGKLSIERLISKLSEVPLLFTLMSVCPLADLELEAALTDVRSVLLLSVAETSNSPEILGFQSALALQCFVNEYVYDQNDKEIKALVALEALVEDTLLKGEQPTPHLILCLATYKPLHEYEWCDLITLTPGIEEVFTRQVLEPNQEKRLKSVIPILQDVKDSVSSKVRAQYEENPYPRWVDMKVRLNPSPISKVIKEVKLKLFDGAINDVEAPRILIAGCGTGQHSIGTAVRFKDAKVLAVDLSLSSLAYAIRKTEEFGLQNVDYMQADILDLSKLNRKFDIIESGGVLHHMNDTMVGWRVLTGCLRSGGLMKIGLYSELARQHIVKMRDEIDQSNFGSSNTTMKSFRNDVMKSDDEHHKLARSSHDFYSFSAFRDLLFHVQEHRFTIPQIKDCLSELGLKFCGFEAERVVQDFKLTNTGADDPYDLDKWNLYEQANPDVFIGMYQFWCQKVV